MPTSTCAILPYRDMDRRFACPASVYLRLQGRGEGFGGCPTFRQDAVALNCALNSNHVVETSGHLVNLRTDDAESWSRKIEVPARREDGFPKLDAATEREWAEILAPDGHLLHAGQS